MFNTDVHIYVSLQMDWKKMDYFPNLELIVYKGLSEIRKVEFRSHLAQRSMVCPWTLTNNYLCFFKVGLSLRLKISEQWNYVVN